LIRKDNKGGRRPEDNTNETHKKGPLHCKHKPKHNRAPIKHKSRGGLPGGKKKNADVELRKEIGDRKRRRTTKKGKKNPRKWTRELD